MLGLARGGHDLRDFGFRDFERIHAAQSDAVFVDLQHDGRRVFARFVEEDFENRYDKIHRRVIVVEQKDLIHRWFLRLRPRFDRDIAVRGQCRRIGYGIRTVADRRKYMHLIIITR